jgi:hypothetical protein
VAFDHEEELLALPVERAAKLAGVSVRRLQHWDQIGLVIPSVKRKLSPRRGVVLVDEGDGAGPGRQGVEALTVGVTD